MIRTQKESLSGQKIRANCLSGVQRLFFTCGKRSKLDHKISGVIKHFRLETSVEAFIKIVVHNWYGSEQQVPKQVIEKDFMCRPPPCFPLPPVLFPAIPCFTQISQVFSGCPATLLLWLWINRCTLLNQNLGDNYTGRSLNHSITNHNIIDGVTEA